jgi:SAM-dependent methyltransferase
MSAHSPEDLQRIYENRFGGNLEYRRAVWRVLITEFFGRFLRPEHAVLDLGCGYGEFINQIHCTRRYAMDLNPNAAQRLAPEVQFFQQDCAARWPLPDGALDVVFTSNFFEHLPDKVVLGRTLDEIRRCLKPDGQLIAVGPNIKYLAGRYWEFWDHYIPLTENSLAEALTSRGFSILQNIGRFLPYTMACGPRYPLMLIRLYVRLPIFWRFFGKQFLVVATKRV